MNLERGSVFFGSKRSHQYWLTDRSIVAIYIIRTSLAPERMDAADCVRNYKALASVERAFRSL